MLGLLLDRGGDRLYADVVGAGLVVGADAFGDAVRVTPGDDGVDERVAAAVLDVGVPRNPARAGG